MKLCSALPTSEHSCFDDQGKAFRVFVAGFKQLRILTAMNCAPFIRFGMYGARARLPIFSIAASLVFLSGCGERDAHEKSKSTEEPRLTVGFQASPAMALVM